MDPWILGMLGDLENGGWDLVDLVGVSLIN